MRFRFPTSFALFSLLFLTLSSTALAQHQAVVQLSGPKMRAALRLPKGLSSVQLCGLEPGFTYKVIASPKTYGQRADFEITPATVPTKGASNFAFMRLNQHALRFAAPGACVQIQVNSNSPEPDKEIPMYFSIVCESCPESSAWRDELQEKSGQTTLTVQGDQTAEELIKNVLVGGDCFQISNISYQGQPTQIGSFANGLTNIGFSNGVILATGNIIVAPGPNNSQNSSAGFGFETPDSDLSTLTTGEIHDLASIEFDFRPTQSQVAFEFVFASEEYCEYIGDVYNDVFGFFISGPGIAGTQNIALVPNTNLPITVNNINHLANTQYYTHNIPSLNLDCPTLPPATGPATQEIEYDGFTKKMVALANLVPCQTYHIKLKIADVHDGVWDSAVFLRANSFSAGGKVLATPVYPGNQGAAFENCGSGNIRLVRGNSDLSQPLVVNFSVGGSALPGIDYLPLSSPVTIPAGQMELLLPVEVIEDQLAEGTENILLGIDNSCSCAQNTVEYLIRDRPELTLTLPDQSLCAGDTATLTPTISGGLPDYTYLWSTGETTQSIQTVLAGAYTLHVTDGCGVPSVLTSQLAFADCDTSDACDIKTNDCVKFELLTITADPGGNRTYRIRVTNYCFSELIYTAIQIPSGLVAMEPADASTYLAPSGNTYLVRSPNFSPQYSIRYRSLNTGIHSGGSDIFRYTLPAQADVDYIHLMVKLAPNVFLGAHLNTFYCPIGVTPTGNRPREETEVNDWSRFQKRAHPAGSSQLQLFPNPSSGELYADLSPWQGEALQIQVLDSRGQGVQRHTVQAASVAQRFDLPDNLSNGLYFIEILTGAGKKHTGRFVVLR